MKRMYILVYLFVAFGFTASAQSSHPNTKALPRPKLVVGIIVDQMRWDYLYRYYERYGQVGFKRMLDEGFTCENTYIDYVPTVTAIGHATVYTGSVPAIHGITGNDYVIQQTGKTQNSSGDTTVQTVGSTSRAGQVSPRNLLSSTITDELRLATNFKSKVIGVAMKDRGSIFPAGHAANAAYWYDDLTGNWITSTYYMQALPPWVRKFNDQKLAKKYLLQDWRTLYDLSTYVQSTADNSKFEGRFSSMESPTFPVITSKMFEKDFSILRTTPFGNSLTVEMAKAAIENEQLGQRNITDFLALSFSSTDAVGHRFGVNAIETEDTYLRLDKDIADLFTFLDKQVGKNQYTVFLTADHGAAHNASFLHEQKIPAGRWEGPAYEKELNQLLKEKFGVDKLVLSFLNYQVNLNHPVITQHKLDEQAIRNACIGMLKQKPGVAYILEMDKVGESIVPEPIRSRIIKGYHAERSGALQIILDPAWISGYATGSGHSVWNAYDSHIPLLWMGWGIRQGKTNKVTHMTDVAPTLAALLRIQEPNGSIGQPITEVIK